MLQLDEPKTTLRVAHTSDPDDAFAWWAISENHVEITGYNVAVETHHIQDINEACLREEYDIAAISSAAWPFLHEKYAILASGASVGRGYGPVLATREDYNQDISKAIVAVPGKLTTGALLLRLFYPEAKVVSMPFDKIANAILTGKVDAGVLIHEELLNWKFKELKKVLCLGKKWQEETSLPIPVGLNVVHLRLGKDIFAIQKAVKESMVYAQENSKDAQNWGLNFSIQAENNIAQKFIGMFANDDTVYLPEDCVAALNLLYQISYERKLIPTIPKLNIIY